MTLLGPCNPTNTRPQATPAITLHDGARTATIGAAAGITLVLALAVVLRRVFRWIPPKYLDLIAGIALVGYGIVFAVQALR